MVEVAQGADLQTPGTPPVTPPVTPPETPPVMPPVTPPVTQQVPPADQTPPVPKSAPADGGDTKETTPKEETKKAPVDTDVWGTTGSEVGDSVLSVLGAAGLKVDDTEVQNVLSAVQAGNADTIDVAALEAKIGKDKATLVLAGTRAFLQEVASKNAAALETVHTAAGGKENWGRLADWARTNIADAQLSEYRDMIDNGGAQARFAVAELASAYNQVPAHSTLNPAALVTGDAAGAPTGRATSRAEFVIELEKAHRTKQPQSVLDEISAARAAGRAAGK